VSQAVKQERRQVLVIGAGPSGAIASALLRRQGRDVLVLERQRFPRFSIGESLLVHCLDFVAEAGMLEAVDSAGFQCKNGAAFAHGDRYAEFDFSDRFTPGRPSTYQVQRAAFDKILADEAARQGVEIRYETEIVAVDFARAPARLTARSADGGLREIDADFVLDASGTGRVLARLLALERPSDFPVRHAIVTHVADRIPDGVLPRNMLRVMVHPQHCDVWYWIIPFAAGRSSIGVVAPPELLQRHAGSAEQRLRQLVGEEPGFARLLAAAEWDTPVREIAGYSANVRSMHGPGFALLGNAAEFLDPVFSSGVTVAMRSASVAADLADRQLAGAPVDWQRDFEQALRTGIDCFRAYVNAWYDGRFQNIVFHKRQPADVRRMICSILAGYAWDLSNPFVADPVRRLDVLAQLCAA
jgi:flavin-dependent dehydrogenase